SHAVVPRLMFDFGQAEALQHGRNIVCEAPAQALLQAVPAADGILRVTRPSFDGARGRALLFVGAAERHPVRALDEHRVEIVETPQLITQLRLADLHDERGRIRLLVAVGGVFGSAARRLERPRIGARALTRGHRRLPAAKWSVPRDRSRTN